MPGAAPEQEPSIEEILASIRQIISDDDEGAPAVSAEPEPIADPAPPPPPVSVPPPPPPEPKEDILELKDPLPPPNSIVIDMEDALEEEPMIAAAEIPVPAPERRPEPAPAPAVHDASILTDAAKMAALSGFSKLTGTMNMDRGTTAHVSSGGSTLEDIVRDMLNPLLRTWLDENLPPIIEKLVQKELDKLARKAMDD